MSFEDDMYTAMDRAHAEKNKAREAAGQWTLGQLISALEKAPAEARVTFDFCGIVPTDVDSYRGYYEQLAIGWKAPDYGDERPTVGTLLATLRDAVGATMCGWKGGDYVMGTDTPVWVDNSGECYSTMVVGVDVDGGHVVILTQHERGGW